MAHTKSETEPATTDLGDMRSGSSGLHRVRQVNRLDRRPKRDGLRDVRKRATQRKVAANTRARQPSESTSLGFSSELKNGCPLVG